MKTFFRLSAVLLLSAATALTTTAKPRHHKMNDMSYNQVSIIPLKHNRGFAIHVDKAIPGKSMVIINDDSGNTVFKDCLTRGTLAEKKYMLRELDNGKYSVEIYAKGHDIKTNFYIYNNGNRRVVDIM
ncbi:hypothetical protein [Mucilaginibacter ginsenosidivorans]|uniref:DUF3244 domain-containing protein n=1 Tax=Mucilaginibacter ginsenosidivorans TaxID=398053 RepID=A0A5B8US28_9SPHI|nr:hypothetical protein [Mucilaginibacter ginsenosidivorans]QEC61535.1 hypothetical protein FRZ54_02690 [Mucilaginibacter ginsenosidivorans]